MSNEFRLIQGNHPDNSGLLASMHRLRCQVFHRELHWTAGLTIVGDMEFDEYDQADTDYIVRLDGDGAVDAACRLIPTSRPYMIAEHYPQFIAAIPLPQSDDVWEISRFCASEKARRESKGRITGQLIAAAIEFGLSKNIKNYVALATDTVVPVFRRVAGWDPRTLGERGRTPNDFSFSVLYTVSRDMLDAVRRKNNINRFLLFDVPAEKEQGQHTQTGDRMDRTPHIKLVPQQIKNKTGSSLEEMETTLAYLETVAFSHGYEAMLAGLKLTRLVLRHDKKLSPDAGELAALDDAYAKLRRQLADGNHARL